MLRINPRTKAVQTLASSPFEDPFGIAVTRAGTIFVAEEGDERGVYRLLPGGSPIEIGTPRSSRRRASL